MVQLTTRKAHRRIDGTGVTNSKFKAWLKGRKISESMELAHSIIPLGIPTMFVFQLRHGDAIQPDQKWIRRNRAQFRHLRIVLEEVLRSTRCFLVQQIEQSESFPYQF
ncbi:MAG TPA: hypothetical protein DDZ83_16745 [Nitrospinae bacterium]|nr:hypothetical protein [Nitrospinota bacterium]